MDTGHAAWVLTSASLVLLMTPGLALFYGGMARARSVLNMMMMSFGAIGVVAVVYVLWGWSMSYGADAFGDGVPGLFANPFQMFGLGHVPADDYVWVGFQMTFAVIATALISGAIADRAKFSTWLVFCAVWVTLSYFPLAHMVWGGGFLSGEPGGLASRLSGGVTPVDYAGGTVVHINAGVAGLVLALVLGARHDFGREPMRPHNLPLTMLGAGLLWFGWFGFNVGSYVPSVRADAPGFAAQFVGETGLVWVNTMSAGAAAMLGWLAVERLRHDTSTSLGAASGAVAGLVAITPACGALSPLGSLVLGAAAGGLCSLAVDLKYRYGFDDSFDVVGVHLVGGMVGTIGIGFLGSSGGLLYGGGGELLVVQVAIALFAVAWSGAVTAVVALTLRRVMGWRVAVEPTLGVDVAEHGETAYDLAGVADHPRGSGGSGGPGLAQEREGTAV